MDKEGFLNAKNKSELIKLPYNSWDWVKDNKDNFFNGSVTCWVQELIMCQLANPDKGLVYKLDEMAGKDWVPVEIFLSKPEGHVGGLSLWRRALVRVAEQLGLRPLEALAAIIEQAVQQRILLPSLQPEGSAILPDDERVAPLLRSFDIDYDELDEKVRAHVQFFNSVGLETSNSCQGHSERGTHKFYVQFQKYVNDEDIRKFMRKFPHPFYGVHDNGQIKGRFLKVNFGFINGHWDEIWRYEVDAYPNAKMNQKIADSDLEIFANAFKNELDE